MRKGVPADRGPLKQGEKEKTKAPENKDDEEQDNHFVSHLIVLPSPVSPLATDLQAPPNPPLDDVFDTFHEEVEEERPQKKNEENNQLVKQILRVMKPKVGNQTPPRPSSSPSATYYSPSRHSAPGSPSETHSFQRTFRRGRSFDESQRNKDMWGKEGVYEGLRCIIDSSRMRVLLEEQVGSNFVRLRRGRKSVGLGSSDMADVCGHGRGLPLHFWQQILIQKELRESGQEIPDTGNPMTRHGHRFERVAKRVYEIISGNVCYAGGVWRILLEESALWVSCSPTDSWDLLGCSPDSCVLFDSPPVPADLLLLLPPTSSHSLSSLIIDHFQDHPLLSSIQQTLSFDKDPSILLENSQPTQPRHPQDPTKSPSTQTRKSSSSPLIKTSQMVLRDRTRPGGFHRLKSGVEFKCPVFRMYDKVPEKYVTQMQYQAWAMRVPYIDFCAVLIRPRSVAFSTRDPDTCNYDSMSDSDFVVEEIMVARMYRNERFISWMMPLVRAFSSCLWHKEKPSWGWTAVPAEVKCRIEVLIKGRVDQEYPSEIRCPSTFTDAWTHLPDLNALLLRWNILKSLAPILPVISSSESPSW